MERHRLTGKTDQIVDSYNAPDDIKSVLAKRIAALCGRQISHDRIQEVIIEQLGSSGQPNWNAVIDTLGDMVKRVYKGKKII